MSKKLKNREGKMWSKCAYGFADIYGGGAFVIISTFYTVFLTKALGMPIALAGAIPLIGKVWDAVIDPIMGNMVDRTHSKFGSKRFYILIGSIISAITFVLMWVNVSSTSLVAQFLFYEGMYMLFAAGFTIVMVPYNGLLPDMVDDYTTRSKFSSIRTIFSTFGAIIAGLIPTVMIKDNTNPSLYLDVALIFAVIFFVVIILTFAGTWEKEKPVVKLGLKESFTQSFTVYKSHSYKLFIAIFLCGQGAADFVTGLAVYYVDDVLHCYHSGMFTLLMGLLLVAQFLGTIIFSFIMPRTSKKFPILLGFPIRIAATLALLLCSREYANEIMVAGPMSLFHVMLLLSFIIGLGMAASSVSIYAILADMSDVDELITSINRPGTVSGMATFIRQIATGLSSGVIGVLLAMVGYDEVAAKEGLPQVAAVQTGITQIYVWAPIILMAFTIVFAVLFPMNRKEFEIIKKEIARRKGEDTSVAAETEIAVCEKVTGYKYDCLWNQNNALKFKYSK